MDSREHPGEDEVHMLLTDLLDGVRAADDPEVRALLRRHPELEDELAWMRELRGKMERAGSQAASEIAEATGAALDAQGQAALASARIRFASESDASSSVRDRRRGAWLLAAAILVGVSTWWLLAGGDNKAGSDPGKNERVLSDASSAGLEPQGVAGEWTAFSWPERPAPGQYFRVRVLRADGSLVVESPELAARRWQPSAREMETIRAMDRFRWELVLEAEDGSDAVQGFAEVQR